MDHFINPAIPGGTSATFGSKKRLIWFFASLLALSTLACGFADRPSGRIVIRGTLPTLTPTPNQVIAQRNPNQPTLLASPAGESATNPAVTAGGNVPTDSDIDAVATAPAMASSNISPNLPNEVVVTPDPNLLNNTIISAPSGVVQPAGAVAPVPSTTPLAVSPSPTALATISAGGPTPTLAPAEPTPTPTTVPLPASALIFANVRTFSAVDGAGLLLYGDVINQSDSAQEIKLVTGQFLDGQGQVIADESRVSGYWPVEIVSPQEKVPFELYAEGIQNAADFKLRLDAQPSGSAPRRDFEVSTAYQENDEFGLCVGGTLQNSGGEIQDYLVIAAVLYDLENKMISFGDTSISPAMAISGQTEEFEICADSFGQNVGRYELQAWGR